MDFLEKLYSNENFGLYLVIAIAVLVVLFFIVLFLGKKDEKKIKKLNDAKEKEKQLVQNNTSEPIAITPVGNENKTTDNVQSISNDNDKVNINPTVFTPVENNMSAFKEVTEEVPVEAHGESKLEEIQNVVLSENNVNEDQEEAKEFDFEALADAINKELESIKENKNDEVLSSEDHKEKAVIEEKPFSFPAFETIEPDKIPESVINNEKDEIKPVIEEKTKMPNVFSSVYANSNNEPIKSAKSTPFELPKMADLPKKAEEKKEEPQDTQVEIK